MLEYKVSVIVPVYKVEQYLKECVDSIRCQTLQEIEIILVDDGSPDKCGEICDSIAKEDERIKVIHKKNGGLSSARNAGIEIAKGEYIGFVDSDDYISHEMYAKLYSLCKSNNVLMGACNYFHVHGGSVDYVEETRKAFVLSDQEFFRKLLVENGRIEMCAVNKLYHKSVFEKKENFFPEGKLFEDLGSMYKFVFASKKVAYLDEGLYYYRRGVEGSITASWFEGREIERMQMGNAMTEYIRINAPRLYEEALLFKFVNSYLSSMNIMVKAKTCDKKLYLLIKEDIKKNRKSILKGKLPILKKIQLFAAATSFDIYKLLYQMVK